MAKKKKLPRLICYDIANEKRLSRVHRIVSEYAILIQYSVYYFYASSEELDDLCLQLREVINATEDDIRIYPLATRPDIYTLGQQGLLEGLIISNVALPNDFCNKKSKKKRKK